MVEYVIAGLVTGSLYALIASVIAMTYASTGILNFAYAAEAYFAARTFYFLHVVHHWNIIAAAVLSIFVISPLIGLILWAAVFRSLRNAAIVVRVVATIGLAVAITAIASIAFGNEPGGLVPGLAPLPVGVVKVFGAALNTNQIIALAAVALIGIVGFLVMRFTDAGLVLRAIVDSEALVNVTGTNPTIGAALVWMFATSLAGLTGVLVAPTIGLNSSNFTLLMAAAVAAVIAARLRNTGVAVIVGLLLGVIGSLVTKYIPATSVWPNAATTSIPFAVAFMFIIYYMAKGQARESGLVGGVLDRAVAYNNPDLQPASRIWRAERALADGSHQDLPPSLRPRWLEEGRSMQGLAAVVVVVMILSFVLSNFWTGLLGGGVALGVALLSYTVVTGQGGVISLAQITLAGVGGVATAQFATHAHLPVVLAVVMGGLVAVPFGAVLALITSRIGDLYIALLTLMFGVLMDNLVFSMNRFSNFSAGVAVLKPTILLGSRAFVIGMLVLFVVLALLLENLRRSTAGMALDAVRSSELGSGSLGISVTKMRIVSLSVGAFVAGIGGGVLSMYAGAAAPANFATTLGLIWLAVIVSLGVRSLAQAVVAGVLFTVLPQVFSVYLPHSWVQVPTALFGLGAVQVAQHPEGIAMMHVQQVKGVVANLKAKRRSAVDAVPVATR